MFQSFVDELEEIKLAAAGAMPRMHKPKRLFGKLKRVLKKSNFKRMHKRWKWKRPSSGSK